MIPDFVTYALYVAPEAVSAMSVNVDIVNIRFMFIFG